jgi:NAD(P)-dependent dehydrogenase (short-subunit alcohol dehydrogenase family)
MLATVSRVRLRGLRTTKFSAGSTPTCWGDPHNKGFYPTFQREESRIVHQYNTTSIGGLLTVPFNSIYHATKWALEGWGESMAFELNQFGIGINTVERGGMKTDFFSSPILRYWAASSL